jgi:thiamine biosynthesis lipoprotein
MRVRRRPLAAAAVLVLTAVAGDTPGAARRDNGSLLFADAVIAAHRPSPAEDDRAVRWSDLPRATAQPTLERFEGVEPHMGTLVSITVFAPDAATARVAFRAGFDRIRELNEVLSDYLPDSELSRVTREGVRRPVPLSADLFAVLEASHRLSVATGGAFDVTQGPVIRLWREARKTKRVPDAEALQEAAARSGDAHMHLDEAHRTVSFDIAGMQLDVGAIGKGFAASEALAAITRTGVRRALVAVSGDLAFGDPPPGQPGWRIRIHDGNIGDTSIPAVLRLSNLAVSTSGNAEQHLDVDGRRYSHVIDPSSRVGLLDDITVTVISRHGVDADGLDTAIGVLGVERGLALVDRDREAAALIVLRKAGTTHVQASRRLRELVTRQPPVDAARPR